MTQSFIDNAPPSSVPLTIAKRQQAKQNLSESLQVMPRRRGLTSGHIDKNIEPRRGTGSSKTNREKVINSPASGGDQAPINKKLKGKNVEREQPKLTAGAADVLDVFGAMYGIGNPDGISPASAGKIAASEAREIGRLGTHSPHPYQSQDLQAISPHSPMSLSSSTPMPPPTIPSPAQSQTQSTRPSVFSAPQIQKAVSEPQWNGSWQAPLLPFGNRGSQEVADAEFQSWVIPAGVVANSLRRMEQRLSND